MNKYNHLTPNQKIYIPTKRVMHEGNWKCDKCGSEVKKLPFEPDLVRKIYCLKCWKEWQLNKQKQ